MWGSAGAESPVNCREPGGVWGILEVSGVESSYLYRGTQIRPQVTVKIGNKTLSTSDYDVTYGENIKAGTDGGSIMVKGKNEYAGLIKLVTFDY